MARSEIEQIKEEIAGELVGLRFGKIFQLDRMSIAIDFFPHSGRYLYFGFGPTSGSTYLIRRRLKLLEREAIHPTPFSIELKNRLTGSELIGVSAVSGSFALKFDLRSPEGMTPSLVAQLGKNRPGLFLVDAEGMIAASAKNSNLTGQKIGDKYAAPQNAVHTDWPSRELDGESLSDRLDAENLEKRSAEQIEQRVSEVRKRLNNEVRKRLTLIKNLENDLLKHGDADRWKRFGDLLLANMGSIERRGDNFIVMDYFDSEMPVVEIPSDSNASASDAAEAYFKRYTKARNGAAAISARLEAINTEIAALHSRLGDLEAAARTGDETAIADLFPLKRKPTANVSKAKANKEAAEIRGARRFISSDGFEILVGKKAADNDHLTFRIARSLDTWLHAADYPGSHVIVRNPGKKELPSRTLVEAAQLAAFYSDAREMPKAAVRYTPKKYVNKPRKAAPGLVSLSSFKTILVEPRVGDLLRGE